MCRKVRIASLQQWCSDYNWDNTKSQHQGCVQTVSSDSELKRENFNLATEYIKDSRFSYA